MRIQYAFVRAIGLATLATACRDAALPPQPDGLDQGAIASAGALQVVGSGFDQPALGATGSTAQVHFIANGPSALAGWGESDPQGTWYTYGYLEVSQGGTSSRPRTWLHYLHFYCWDTGGWNWVCDALEGGDGFIPNDDFHGSGGHVYLSTNTTGNPDFNVWAGSGGQVTVEWKRNGVYTSTVSGAYEWTYEAACCSTPYKYRTVGRVTQASATVSGAVGSVVLPYIPDGAIGMNHNVTIEIYR